MCDSIPCLKIRFGRLCVRNGSITSKKKKGLAKQTQVMLFGRLSAEDVV